MKVKQPRRWKKHTVQKQGEISNRFSGRILWAMLLLGGIGTLIALGISGGSGTPQNSSRTISDSAFQKVDEKLTAAFPARNLFLRTLTNGIAATGGNRIGDVYFTEERLLECPKQLDAAALSDTASPCPAPARGRGWARRCPAASGWFQRSGWFCPNPCAPSGNARPCFSPPSNSFIFRSFRLPPAGAPAPASVHRGSR